MSQTVNPPQRTTQGPSRRTFLKWSGVAAGVAGLAATSHRASERRRPVRNMGMDGRRRSNSAFCVRRELRKPLPVALAG